MLDLKLVPERLNTVKVLLSLDIGGSMDVYVKLTEELFSAGRSEFKHYGPDDFDFQDKLARDADIRLEAVAGFRALIEDGNCDLPGEGNACVCQFSVQAQLIYGFQQSWAGMSVHPDHPIGQDSARSITPSP
jgi:hypothetical protein